MNTLKRKKKLSQIAILTVALVSHHGAYAQTDDIEEIMVWGTQVNASSIKLDEEHIAIRQVDHISDLLRTIPGVDVGGAHSLNQRITIRSMDDKDLRITIDGANQNTYMYHHMGNLQIHADILQSVDVEIGTNSVINGGLGGQVRFETKSADNLLPAGQQFGSRVQATYGDNSGTNYAFTAYGLLADSVDVLAYHNSVDRDDYKVGGGIIKDSAGQAIANTDGMVRGLKGDLSDSLFKLGWDISENQRLEFGYETYKDQGDYSYRPDMGLATDLAITNSLNVPLLWPTEFTRDTWTVNYDLHWGGHSSLKASAFTNTSELQRDESGWAENGQFASSAALVTGEAENQGFNLLGESELDDHLLTYGAEFIGYDTHYSAAYITANTDLSGEKASNLAVFIQDKIQLTDALTVIPGLRYDRYDVQSTVVDDDFSEVTLAIAAEYALSTNLLAKASTTQIFKGPEIGEVFTGAGLFDTANQNIDAETGLNTELSIAFEDALLGADQLSAGLTLFHTNIDDYIYDYATPPPSVGGRYWKDNVGNMKLDGLEAYAGYDKGHLSALLTFSKSDSELDAFSQYTALSGARLDRQQGNTFSLNVDYDLPQLNLVLHWDVLSVGSVDAGINLDGATLDNAKDSYTVHNISAQWRPQNVQGFALTLGVDNAFDEYYASQSSRTGTSFHPRFGTLYLLDYEPGRNIKMTLSYQL